MAALVVFDTKTVKLTKEQPIKINKYKISKREINHIKLQALKVIKKSKHFKFFKQNPYNYNAINHYQGFVIFDKPYDIRNNSTYKLSFELNYICWFVIRCLYCGYGDWAEEFDHDLNNNIYLINHLKENNIFEPIGEIRHFLIAYKILCQPSIKLKQHIDIEYWMCDIKDQIPKQEWYSYYLPVNLDDGSQECVSNSDILKAREKIALENTS